MPYRLPRPKIKYTKEFFKSYSDNIAKLYVFLLPLLEKGWSEDDVYKLLKFMEGNKEGVKNKELDEVLKIYKKHVERKKL